MLNPNYAFVRGLCNMVHSYNGGTKWSKWMSIFLLDSRLLFYPPKFTIRNPIVSRIKKAFGNQGEIAIVVFHISKMDELKEMAGEQAYYSFFHDLKKEFEIAIKKYIYRTNIMGVQDFNQDSIVLYERSPLCTPGTDQLDNIIGNIHQSVQESDIYRYSPIELTIGRGYMYCDRTYINIETTVNRAFVLAHSMARNEVEPDYNDMIHQLTGIIHDKSIRLMSQAILEVETGKVKAWEMLSRGPSGTKLENPLTLFADAKQTGRLFTLEMIVLEKVFQHIQMTDIEGDIYINFTPITMGERNFPGHVEMLLKKYEIEPSVVVFEITERDSIEGVHLLRSNVSYLRSLGIRIAIDDTGAGYASLHIIGEVLPDIIKIDRTVIQNIHSNRVKESMLKGLLLIAKETGSLVVAEGIENEDEAMVMVRNKVDLAQGYFYGRPQFLELSLATI